MSLQLATSNSQTDIEHLMSIITLFVNDDVQIGSPRMFWKAHTNPIPTWSRWTISSNLRGPRASSPRSVLYQHILFSTEERRLWHALSWSWDNILPCSSLYIFHCKTSTCITSGDMDKMEMPSLYCDTTSFKVPNGWPEAIILSIHQPLAQRASNLQGEMLP